MIFWRKRASPLGFVEKSHVCLNLNHHFVVPLLLSMALKLLESSLKIHFGILGMSWGLRNHFQSKKTLKMAKNSLFWIFLICGFFRGRRIFYRSMIFFFRNVFFPYLKVFFWILSIGQKLKKISSKPLQ